MREVGHEFGTTTGRSGAAAGSTSWPSSTPYASAASAPTAAITKLDVLTGLPTLKVCTRYKAGRQQLDEFPLLQTDFHHAKPLYEELAGWTEDIRDCDTWQDLPQAARDYVQYIAEFTKTRVKFIAVGSASPSSSSTSTASGASTARPRRSTAAARSSTSSARRRSSTA